MDADTFILKRNTDCAESFSKLAMPGFANLVPLTEKFQEVHGALDHLARIGDRPTEQTARKLQNKLAVTEPSVTMIGQVKAGKTSLVNAMVGWPDLLPADVNPWTSVVTSLHISPKPVKQDTQARFQFFNRDEWDKLVLNGGRMGELAGRAGADSEVEKVRQQIAEMQEKSRRRLGRKFELLLGQTHDYGYFDGPLIERYVCLGDDFEDQTETSKTQGRFADITKSAEVFMHRPDVPMPLCIRDTPGVNDTFMVREQITIRAIRDSRTCVVVLSAHQALSSVDMALIRLIANVKSRDVIIFVNRIDELSDPGRQIPEIEESIRKTLADHQGPLDAEIIFGSAYWANEALHGITEIETDSAAALANWAWANAESAPADEDEQTRLWRLSGVPALYAALSDRIADGHGKEVLDTVAKSARNLASGIRVSNNIVSMRRQDGNGPKLDRQKLADGLQRIQAVGRKVIEQEFDKLIEDFNGRVDRAHHNFLRRATAALIDHLERFGETTVWKYEPTGLRVLLRSAYQSYSKKAQDATNKILRATAADITKVYRKAHLVNDPAFAIEAPHAPRVPPPVLLGQTIALDMQANWWSRWWRRQRGYQAFAEEFFGLIQAETEPITYGLKQDHALSVRNDALSAFMGFLKEQIAILTNLAEQDNMTDDELAAAFGVDNPRDRQSALADAMETLDKFAA
ncbi:dynamin family protein [Pseudoruegeria sp. HB172150]|uniref:dynamin family protein n=1 Tax=Pseudoruegeria sp. HB172150 TaxID=2721164 RepID=UPI001553A4AE|nr:dynamin family protein [Pseudoruegeria sp. HB172150]